MLDQAKQETKIAEITGECRKGKRSVDEVDE
jgi:hypothetical protein